MSLKDFNDTIGNRTRDLPVCSAVITVIYTVYIYLRNMAPCFGYVFSHCQTCRIEQTSCYVLQQRKVLLYIGLYYVLLVYLVFF